MPEFIRNWLSDIMREHGQEVARQLLIDSIKALLQAAWALTREYPYLMVPLLVVLAIWALMPIFTIIGTINRWRWGREKKKLDRTLGKDIAELVKLQREQNELLRTLAGKLISTKP